MSWFSQGLPPEEFASIPEEEQRVLDTLARKVVQWRMAPPAIMYLESFKPMNYIASQGMVFFGPILEPICETIFNYREYDVLRRAMERRSNVENLILAIERYDALAYTHDAKVKKFIARERKTWRWYQRWLGVGRPKIALPEELRVFDIDAALTAAQAQEKNPQL